MRVFSFRGLAASIALALAAAYPAQAADDVSLADLKAATRSLGFLQNPPKSGGYAIGVVYAPGSANGKILSQQAADRIRSLPGPVFFPLRVLGIAYADFFRGVPTILVIALLGFGAPALQLSWVPLSTTFWGIVALTLVYTAYVSEVYRAGIESVHPSQNAAARSLGLSHWQSLQKVVLPQAVRRVIPPLLNDFIGLQKDTALVGFLGSVEAFKQSQIDAAATFNYTPFVAAAVLFVALTIPLARFTDWLVLRDRRRRQATGV